MLALCLMLSKTYYAQNYAGIIGMGLTVSTYKVSLETKKKWPNDRIKENCKILKVYCVMELLLSYKVFSGIP